MGVYAWLGGAGVILTSYDCYLYHGPFVHSISVNSNVIMGQPPCAKASVKDIISQIVYMTKYRKRNYPTVLETVPQPFDSIDWGA